MTHFQDLFILSNTSSFNPISFNRFQGCLDKNNVNHHQILTLGSAITLHLSATIAPLIIS